MKIFFKLIGIYLAKFIKELFYKLKLSEINDRIEKSKKELNKNEEINNNNVDEFNALYALYRAEHPELFPSSGELQEGSRESTKSDRGTEGIDK